MGADVVFVGKYAFSWQVEYIAGGHLAGSCIRGRGQPALPRALDRWHPKHDVGWVGFRFRFPVERSRLLLGWHRCRRTH